MSKTAYAYETIKSLIVTGELPPLKELSEKELQEKLEVSRTPIREAFQALQRERFLDIYPRKRIVVTPITFHLLEEIFDTRMLLEPQLFKRACGKIPDQTLLKLREAHLEPPANLDMTGRSVYYNDLDSQLHSTVFPYINNHFVENVFRVVQDHEVRIRNILFDISTNQAVIDEHVAIINALLQRSEQDVEKRVIIHTENARKKAFLHFFDHAI